MSTEAYTPTRRALATQAGALALFGSPASVVAPQGDTELLRLGARLTEAWAAEEAGFAQGILTAAEGEALFDRTSAIVRSIEQLQATTLAGLLVKARACHWTHDGEPVDPNFFSSSEKPTTDCRLAASILRDLLALAAPSTRST